MKTIHLLGSRSKSDFAIYLAHVIAKMGKRVLVVDSTKTNEYLYSYIRHEENEYLYDLQNIEILIGTNSWTTMVERLNAAGESVDNFDCLIVDSNDNSVTYNDWPQFHHTFYIGDNNRFTIMQDVDILNSYADYKGVNEIKRIHFESPFKVPEGYIDILLNNRISFIEVFEPMEYDDSVHKLRNYMQHESAIPYNRLNKQYKQLLKILVTEMFSIGNKDLEASLKNHPFANFFGRFKSESKQQNEPNKYTGSQAKGVTPVVLNQKQQLAGEMKVLSAENIPGDLVEKSDTQKSKEYIGG